MAERFIGLMSGTSMDALDAVLIDFSSQPLHLCAALSRPLPDELRAQLFSLTSPGENEIERAAQADVAFARFSAETVNQLLESANTASTEVCAVGSHGQTIRHGPYADPAYTVQIGDGNLIAHETGITTVADFRRRDMAAGGQGAPLVPAFHQALFRHPEINRVVLNVGGMANISILPAETTQPVSGFDTGPGNVLMDSWIQHTWSVPYDHCGEWARRGHIDKPLLQRLLSDPYFAKVPPKSTGREHFNLDWLQSRLAYHDIAANDVQATLCELTASSIAQSIQRYAPDCNEVLVCGGGAENTYLMERLGALMPACRIHSTAEYGLDPRWVEAVAFAWLARQTINCLPGNLPAVTGATDAVILGAIYPAPTFCQ